MLNTMSSLNPSSTCPHRRVTAAICRWLSVALLLAFAMMAWGSTPNLVDLSNDTLGRWLSVMPENGVVLDIDEARRMQGMGAFQAATSAVPKFGIGAPPIWVHLQVNNTGRLTAERRLQLEVSGWTASTSITCTGMNCWSWRAGDRESSLQHPHPGLGYVRSRSAGHQ